MSPKRRRSFPIPRPNHDDYNQMALEDGASEAITGEIPYLQPVNWDGSSELLFVSPGEDTGALGWDETRNIGPVPLVEDLDEPL